MSYVNGFIYGLSIIIYMVLALQACYLLVFALAGRLFRSNKYTKAVHLSSFVIYIPSYKEDAVILETASAALQIDYPVEKIHIVIIADSLQPETLVTLRSLPIQVVEVSFEKSTKAKALNAALQQTADIYDNALILDADNICATDCLYQLNNVLDAGFKVVQGQRVAKNTNTAFAMLDAVSEGINNHIFRKGHRAVGLSCAIIGSGVALNYALFKSIMPDITAVGGFDKEMELRLLKQHIKFGYAETALIYDEKTAQPAIFENQRRRWLSAQLHYMQRYLGEGFIQLIKGNVDFFDKVIQTLLLPRILLLGITIIAFILSLIPGPALPREYWLVLCSATILAVVISIPANLINRRLAVAMISLPLAFLKMFKLMFKLKGANKTFIHTPHGNNNSVN